MSRDEFDPPDGFDSHHFLFLEMSRADWSWLLRELLPFAASQVKKFRWTVPPDPEEIAYECLDKVLLDPSMWKPERRRDALEPREALKRFLFQVIWRHLQRARELKWEDWRVDNLDAAGRDRLEALPNAERSPEERLDDERRREKIREVERHLDDRGYGELFALTYRDELKPREIADLLGIARERIHALLQQMRALMRRHFGGDEFLRELFGLT